MSIEFVPETPVVIDTEIASIIEENAATGEIPDAVPENPDASSESSSENPDALIRVLKSGS